MKRSFPFLIILAVALLTVGAAAMLYRAKVAAHPAPLKAPSPTDSKSLNAQGPRDAPATLEIYGDFQCHPCATASLLIGELQKQYGTRLRVVFREFPLAMHAYAFPAAMAAEAAGLQGRFWEMHDLLYNGQKIWSETPDPDSVFKAYAVSLGLNLERFAADTKSKEIKARILAERDAGTRRGVKSTPTLFINGTEARPPFAADALQSAVEAAIATRTKG